MTKEIAFMKEFNIVLAGVGGQGILLAAEILGTAALKDGLNVRMSEIHGMAQRGGAVTSHVRVGRSVLAPTVLEGRADILLGFEPLETLRNLKYASEKTVVIMSDEKMPPPGLISESTRYPSMSEIFKKIHTFTKKVLIVETTRLSAEAGNTLTQNIVLIGALVAIVATEKLPVKRKCVVQAIKELVPSRYVETNIRAFDLGYNYVKGKD